MSNTTDTQMSNTTDTQMSNTTDTQTAAPILAAAAVIELWRLGVELGAVTREEAVAHLATLGLTL